MKKGFTLLELLAVIIILGLIASITIYQTSKSTNYARQETLKESARNIINAADNYYADLGYTNFPKGGVDIKDLELKTTDFISGKVRLIENEYYVVDLTDGKYCINGTKENFNIVKGDCDSTSNTKYVYYASETAFNSETGMPEPISIDDCSEDEPDKIVYLKFSVENNELGTPMVCTTYLGDELCYGEDFADYSDDLLHKFGYYNSDWINVDVEGSNVKTSPDGKTMCGYNDQTVRCKNEDIFVNMQINNSMLQIVDYNEWFFCVIGEYNESFIAACGTD